MSLESLGKNIRKYRIKNNLRQEDLAEKTILSPNYIGMVERGEKTPSLESFIAILNALDVSADMVMSDVLNAGYKTKNSMLDEKLSSLKPNERAFIYDVIETMLKHF